MSINETKNTTILAMDVVGYSAKMNEDEISTTEILKNARVIIEKFYEVTKMWNLNLAVEERDKLRVLRDEYGWN